MVFDQLGELGLTVNIGPSRELVASVRELWLNFFAVRRFSVELVGGRLRAAEEVVSGRCAGARGRLRDFVAIVVGVVAAKTVVRASEGRFGI